MTKIASIDKAADVGTDIDAIEGVDDGNTTASSRRPLTRSLARGSAAANSNSGSGLRWK